MTQPLGTIRQLAYVVEDMDAALDHWINTLGAGPFFTMEHAQLSDQKYYGKHTEVDITIALGNSGDLQIELIVQHNDGDSVYKDFLDAGRTGVHHIALMPEDYDAAYRRYEALGYKPAFELSLGGVPVVYFDTLATTGHYIELWGNDDMFKQMFQMVEDAAKDWDGKDPVRPMPT
jgi:hypothetical protein